MFKENIILIQSNNLHQPSPRTRMGSDKIEKYQQQGKSLNLLCLTPNNTGDRDWYDIQIHGLNPIN
jgi:hypothetical protein